MGFWLDSVLWQKGLNRFHVRERNVIRTRYTGDDRLSTCFRSGADRGIPASSETLASWGF